MKNRIWQGLLSEENMKNILDSPVRKTIARELLSGKTTVFLFIESGDKNKDDTIEKLLNEQLNIMKKNLKLSDMQEHETVADIDTQSAIEIKIDFSVIRLSRQNPHEKVLIDMLLKMEPNLKRGKPVMFPIFGRGKALCPFIGKGINKDNIWDACHFLTGPCSCMVKTGNPGVDILIAIDWEKFIFDNVDLDKELPPVVLTGFSGFSESAGIDSKLVKDSSAENLKNDDKPVSYTLSEEKSDNALARNTLIIILVLLSIVIIGSLLYLINK